MSYGSDYPCNFSQKDVGHWLRSLTGKRKINKSEQSVSEIPQLAARQRGTNRKLELNDPTLSSIKNYILNTKFQCCEKISDSFDSIAFYSIYIL